MLDIQLARPDDAQAIHLILQETWGDSLLFDVFTDHISSPEHQVFVAIEAGKVAGFLSAFLTYRGLWIDGFVESQLSSKEQHNVIRKARSYLFSENRSNTGISIPDNLKHTIGSDLLTTATNHGQYHRWQYAYK